jgi:glycosyltransferase involved in cell wall biosynthesis
MSLAVVITTFNRKDILKETIGRVAEHIKYSGGEVRVFIADDGSTDGTQEMAASWPFCRIVQSNRAGLGGNANAGLKMAFQFSDVVFQFQDDMWIDGPLDMTPHVQLLREKPEIGWIRIGHYLNHNFTAQMRGEYWHLLWNSQEYYIASDQPHVKHRRFHDFFGYYPEGLKIADTENSWCGRTWQIAQISQDAPQVWLSARVPHQIWRHVGPSWQSEGL